MKIRQRGFKCHLPESIVFLYKLFSLLRVVEYSCGSKIFFFWFSLHTNIKNHSEMGGMIKSSYVNNPHIPGSDDSTIRKTSDSIIIPSRGSEETAAQHTTWRVSIVLIADEFRGFDLQKPMSHNLMTPRHCQIWLTLFSVARLAANLDMVEWFSRSHQRPLSRAEGSINTCFIII